MADKRFNIGYDTGYNIYGIVIRQSDGYYYELPAQDDFVASPSNPYQLFTEDTVAKGFYVSTIAEGNVWSDGVYDIVYYERVGASPDPSVDTPVGNAQFEIRDDAILTRLTSAGSIATEIFNTTLDQFKYVTGSFGQKQATDASDPVREYPPNGS